jgi:hypothetical protein
VAKADWERHVDDTTAMMLQEQSPQQLLKIRARLYALLGHCIPADTILIRLTLSMLTRLRPNAAEEAIAKDVVSHAAFYVCFFRVGVYAYAGKPIATRIQGYLSFGSVCGQSHEHLQATNSPVKECDDYKTACGHIIILYAPGIVSVSANNCWIIIHYIKLYSSIIIGDRRSLYC